MLKRLSAVAIMLVSFGCAGIQTSRTESRQPLEKSAKFVVMPFHDPVSRDAKSPGIGAMFSSSFATQCSLNGVNVIQAASAEFSSSREIDQTAALDYARRNGFDYVITGQVTRWVDRATEWNSRRDFAGLEVTVWKVSDAKAVFTSEMVQHSNVFWSGTPDDFIVSLSRDVANELYEKCMK